MGPHFVGTIYNTAAVNGLKRRRFIKLSSLFKRFEIEVSSSVQACTDDETSISKRLNKDDNFTNRLRFNLPNSSAIQAK